MTQLINKTPEVSFDDILRSKKPYVALAMRGFRASAIAKIHPQDVHH